MSGDVTYQALKRLTWIPERDTAHNGHVIAGQDYFDVYFTGGSISGVTLTNIVYGGFTPSKAVATNSFGVLVAATTTDTELGYVSGVTSAIQTQLNGKQATGNYITALTGDIAASGPGSAAATLATVNASVGSFGSSTAIPNFTVNAKGLLTAAGTSVVIAPAGTLTGNTLAAGVTASSLASVGTLTGGATGAGFTVALGTSTISGNLPAANLPSIANNTFLGNGTGSTGTATAIAVTASHLVGVGATGNIGPITLGTNLSMSGATLNVTASSVVAATQADQESASSTTVFVSPGTQQFHPSANKAWVLFDGVGTVTIKASYNVTSITDNGVGTWVVNFTTNFSSAFYGAAGWGRIASGGSNVAPLISAATGQANPSVSACPVTSWAGASAQADIDYVSMIFTGDQ